MLVSCKSENYGFGAFKHPIVEVFCLNSCWEIEFWSLASFTILLLFCFRALGTNTVLVAKIRKIIESLWFFRCLFVFCTENNPKSYILWFPALQINQNTILPENNIFAPKIGYFGPFFGNLPILVEYSTGVEYSEGQKKIWTRNSIGYKTSFTDF